jgi:hypothetical protein
MPFIVSVGTYQPCWGSPTYRVPGDDEDAITLAAEAGRAALGTGAAVENVVLVSRDLPLTESSNAAVLLAGLGLDPELEVTERLGGAPATDYEPDPLPRTDTVYTAVSVHMPVPEMRTPYALAIVKLDGVDARALAKVTGAEPDTVDVGVRGRLALRRVALRSGVPDYGYAFRPETEDIPESLRSCNERNVAVVRAGRTPFGEHFALGIKDLLPMAFAEFAASIDKGVDKAGLPDLRVNPSGGLNAKGHPPGATGVAQCVELFEQLRGTAANQVDGARIGLAHNIGGPTAVSAVTILEGSGHDGI